MIEFVVGLALFIALLAAIGWVADWFDPQARERRAAHRRNHAHRK